MVCMRSFLAGVSTILIPLSACTYKMASISEYKLPISSIDGKAIRSIDIELTNDHWLKYYHFDKSKQFDVNTLSFKFEEDD